MHGGREKTGARWTCLRFLRMSSGRGVVLAGVWMLSNRLSPLFAAATLVVAGGWLAYRLLSAGHPVGAAALGGPSSQGLPFCR